jgi:4-hydroxy-4-methyl-2-oxoglutarate aldolase
MGKYRVGCIDPRIKAVVPTRGFVGVAFTVKTHEGSNLILHKAMTMTKPGDVIVVDAGQNETIAVWGGTFSQICRLRRVAGAVIDGVVRDLRSMIDEGFPVYARGVSPVGPSRAPGSINIPISCGGVLVSPGDVIVSDEDGCVVVARDRVDEVLKRAISLNNKAEDVRRRVEAGEHPIDFFGLAELLNKPEIEVIPFSESD